MHSRIVQRENNTNLLWCPFNKGLVFNSCPIGKKTSYLRKLRKRQRRKSPGVFAHTGGDRALVSNWEDAGRRQRHPVSSALGFSGVATSDGKSIRTRERTRLATNQPLTTVKYFKKKFLLHNFVTT